MTKFDQKQYIMDMEILLSSDPRLHEAQAALERLRMVAINTRLDTNKERMFYHFHDALCVILNMKGEGIGCLGQKMNEYNRTCPVPSLPLDTPLEL